MALNLGPDTTRIVGYDDYVDKLEHIDGKLYIPDSQINMLVTCDSFSNTCDVTSKAVFNLVVVSVLTEKYIVP